MSHSQEKGSKGDGAAKSASAAAKGKAILVFEQTPEVEKNPSFSEGWEPYPDESLNDLVSGVEAKGVVNMPLNSSGSIPQFSLSERQKYWMSQKRQRSNGRYDRYYYHQMANWVFRSKIEVTRFVLYEIYPDKPQKPNKEKIDDKKNVTSYEEPSTPLPGFVKERRGKEPLSPPPGFEEYKKSKEPILPPPGFENGPKYAPSKRKSTPPFSLASLLTRNCSIYIPGKSSAEETVADGSAERILSATYSNFLKLSNKNSTSNQGSNGDNAETPKKVHTSHPPNVDGAERIMADGDNAKTPPALDMSNPPAVEETALINHQGDNAEAPSKLHTGYRPAVDEAARIMAEEFLAKAYKNLVNIFSIKKEDEPSHDIGKGKDPVVAVSHDIGKGNGLLVAESHDIGKDKELVVTVGHDIGKGNELLAAESHDIGKGKELVVAESDDIGNSKEFVVAVPAEDAIGETSRPFEGFRVEFGGYDHEDVVNFLRGGETLLPQGDENPVSLDDAIMANDELKNVEELQPIQPQATMVYARNIRPQGLEEMLLDPSPEDLAMAHEFGLEDLPNMQLGHDLDSVPTNCWPDLGPQTPFHRYDF